MAQIQRIGAPSTPSENKAIRTLAQVLPDDYVVVHNFEISTGRGLPYEYDVVVVGPYAMWNVEVKGFRGTIRGNSRKWVLPSGAVQPSPIPLANRKSRILSDKLRRHSASLRDVFVDTTILLTDRRVRLQLKDDQAFRVIHIGEVEERFTDRDALSVTVTGSIEHLKPQICQALCDCHPSEPIHEIGLYEVVERLNQTDTRTVFLAKHRYIRTRPETILKVFHFDPYAGAAEQERQIAAIFHDQDAMRMLGPHPNLIATGDMFAWEDNKFVLPTEYLDQGTTLLELLENERVSALSCGMRVDIVAGMAKGLRHAHANGVIHRDIRPLNVVVAPEGVVKLVNFDLALIHCQCPVEEPKGLLRRLDRRYAAPEVLRAPGAASPRSDVYSLGIVFHEIVTGRRPYENPREVEGRPPVAAARLLQELRACRDDAQSSMPDDVAEVIARMCDPDPDRRHRDVDELLEDLAILRG